MRLCPLPPKLSSGASLLGAHRYKDDTIRPHMSCMGLIKKETHCLKTMSVGKYAYCFPLAIHSHKVMSQRCSLFKKKKCWFYLHTNLYTINAVSTSRSRIPMRPCYSHFPSPNYHHRVPIATLFSLPLPVHRSSTQTHTQTYAQRYTE